ncbi:MAG: peptidoglycan-binding domain-containing protein [Phormidium sp.]
MNLPSRPLLDLHDENDYVKELQELLNQRGLPLEVNGKFESETQQAVQKFQENNGLPADGIVGPLTWAVLLGINLGDLNVSTSTTRQVVEQQDVNQQMSDIRKRLLDKEDISLTNIVEAKRQSKDDYISKLLKYIPTEVIGVYLTLDALVRSSEPRDMGLYWGIFVFAFIITPIYLWRVQNVHNKKQLFISTTAFFVWIFATGGPFATYPQYSPLYAGVLLIIYTFMLPWL